MAPLPTPPRRRAWRRGPDTLHVGYGPWDGVLVEGLAGSELADLVGGEPAPAAGPCHARRDELLRLLGDHDLDDAPASPATVLVDGSGPVAAQVAALARERGHATFARPEHVDLFDMAVRQGDRHEAPDVVVLVSAVACAATRSLVWRDAGVAHLSLVHDATRVVAGPLVVPGAPCLRCVELHRRDRDPHWAGLEAQTCADPTLAAPAGLAAMGTGLVDILLENYLHGGHQAPGISFEVRLPDPRVVTRRWQRHPECDDRASSVTIER